MDFQIDRNREFRPTVNNNLDLPEDEQIVVEYELPTAVQYNTMVSLDGDNVDVDTVAMVRRQVKTVRNLSVNGHPVSDGKDLANSPLTALVTEIGYAIVNESMALEANPT